MNFDYVVYRYFISNHKKSVLAGFLNLKDAQHFAEWTDGNYLTAGFSYIETEEGKHIFGDVRSYRNPGHIWYKPDEKAFVFNAIEDDVVEIDSVITMDF